MCGLETGSPAGANQRAALTGNLCWQGARLATFYRGTPRQHEPEEADMKRTRHRNSGLRKVCGCPRRQWPKCPHAWRVNYKPKGGPSYRLSLDAHAGKHIASKTEAAKLATGIKAAIDAGAFKTRKEAAAEAATSTRPLATPDAVTLKAFGKTYFD